MEFGLKVGISGHRATAKGRATGRSVMALTFIGLLAGGSSFAANAIDRSLQDGLQLAAGGDVIGAVGCFRRAARLAEEAGDLARQVEAHTRLVVLQPEEATWRGELRADWGHDFPAWLSDEGRLQCPLPAEDVTIPLRDPAIPSGFAGQRYGLILAPEKLPTEQFGSPQAAAGRLRSDPKNQFVFAHALAGYVFDDTATLYGTISGAWPLRFRVFYPSPDLSATKADHAPLARQVLRALLKFYWLGWEYLGRQAMFGPQGVIDVWLCEGGDGAGEQWQNNLYLYQINTPRDGLEWLREIAHEYGHHTLPAVGPFPQVQQHEPWLNGELGERVYLPWLAANLPAGTEQTPWEQEAAERFQVYQQLYSTSLIGKFLKAGVRTPAGDTLLEGGSDAAADYFLGLAMYALAVHGPARWRPVLDTLQPPGRTKVAATPEGFLRAYESVLERWAPLRFLLPPQAFAFSTENPPAPQRPATLSLPPGQGVVSWFYRPAGDWRVTLTARGDGPFQLRVAFDEDEEGETFPFPGPTAHPLSSSTRPLKGEARWHRLRLAHTGGQATAEISEVAVWQEENSGSARPNPGAAANR